MFSLINISKLYFEYQQYDSTFQSNDYEIVDFMVKNLKHMVKNNPLKDFILEKIKGRQEEYDEGKKWSIFTEVAVLLFEYTKCLRTFFK